MAFFYTLSLILDSLHYKKQITLFFSQFLNKISLQVYVKLIIENNFNNQGLFLIKW